MTRQSSYLTSFARTHCVRLPRPIEDAWSWQRQGNCLVPQCREHALNAPEQHGVWGAMSARERARALRGQREHRASERLAIR
jgi:WhiB family transcriptional regulator, redox-sensing transcriptional regulator